MPPLARHLLPDTAEVGPDGRLVVGGVDLVDLAEEHGTPLFVYDEAHLRARCREAVDAFGAGVAYAPRRSSAGPWPASPTRRACTSTSPPAASCTWPWPAGVPAERLVLHGNNKSDGRAAARPRGGVGRIVVDSFDEIDRLEALPGRRPGPEGAGAGHTGRRGPHPRVRHDRPGRLEVRLQPRQRRRRRGRSTRVCTRRRRPRRHPRPHRQPGLPAAESFERRSRCSPRSSPARPARAVHRRRARRRLRRGRGGAVDRRVGRGCSRRAPSRRHRRPGHRRAGALDRRRRRPSRSTRVGTIKDLPGIRTYVSVDGGMSDNPRPVLYGSGYEAFLPRATDAERPRRSRSWASTASRATCSSATPACPPTCRRRHPGHAGDRRLRPLDGVQLQQGAAARGGVRARRGGPAGGAARDARRPAAAG